MDKQLQTDGAIQLDERAVRAKAHQLWIERGCPEGSADQDWFQAERQLREFEQAARVAPPTDAGASTDRVEPTGSSAPAGPAPTTAGDTGAEASERKHAAAKVPLNSEPDTSAQPASRRRSSSAGKTGRHAARTSNRPEAPTADSQAPRSASAKGASKRPRGSKKSPGRRR